jgi:hypothetical protein
MSKDSGSGFRRRKVRYGKTLLFNKRCIKSSYSRILQLLNKKTAFFPQPPTYLFLFINTATYVFCPIEIKKIFLGAKYRTQNAWLSRSVFFSENTKQR